MTINELRENRKKAWDAAKAFVETKRDKDGLLSDEDAKTYAEMEKRIRDYTAEIERVEQMDEIERNLSKPINAPIVTQPMQINTKAQKTGRASDEYRDGMLNALRSNFKQISNVLQEGVDADGGYLVPEEYDSRLIDVLNENNIMRTLSTKITTAGDHKINIAATKPAAAWIEEGGALSFGDATFDQILLDAHKLHVAIKVT
ncbi:MAG: phage major capsid protein, partial [Acutalibacteraceae bacterium]